MGFGYSSNASGSTTDPKQGISLICTINIESLVQEVLLQGLDIGMDIDNVSHRALASPLVAHVYWSLGRTIYWASSIDDKIHAWQWLLNLYLRTETAIDWNE
jgi:hypothetical protein